MGIIGNKTSQPPVSSFGHKLGQEVRCTNSGVVGVVSSLSTQIAGCQFLGIDCEVQVDGETTVREFTSSTKNVEIISDLKVEEYRKIYTEGATKVSNFELGNRVKVIKTGREGILSIKHEDYNGSTSYCVTFPYNPQSKTGEKGDYWASANELILVDGGIREKLLENSEARQEGKLESPKFHQRVRSLLNGCEGVVSVVAEYSNGTIHVGIQPDQQSNVKFQIEFFDIELIENLTDVDGKKLFSQENPHKDKETGCVHYAGAEKIMRSV